MDNAITVTVTGVRTTPCTMAAGCFVTELECSGGQIVDPFLMAIDTLDPSEVDGKTLCAAEKAEAQRMIGKKLILQRVNTIKGCLVPMVVQVVTEPRQGVLF